MSSHIARSGPPSATMVEASGSRRLYRAAGVQEYITVLVEQAQLSWRRLISGSYSNLEAGSDSILRSAIYPGLWLFYVKIPLSFWQS